MKTRPEKPAKDQPKSRETAARQTRHDKFKRVWFVGAGFSSAVGYPLGNALVSELIAYLEGDQHGVLRTAPPKIKSAFSNELVKLCNKAKRDALLKRIDAFARKYVGRKRSSLQGVNVAEFFSIAQALAEAHGPFGIDGPPVREADRSLPTGDDPADFRTLFYDLAAITRSYFVDICTAADDAWPGDFSSVMRGLAPDTDALVNFNWDEEIDCYLYSRRDPENPKVEYDVAYTLASREKDNFLMLKPHGSIGWYDASQCIGNEDLYFVADQYDDRIARFDKRLIYFAEVDRPQDLEDQELEYAMECPPVITPPTFGKRFPYAEQHVIWNDVLEVCRSADEFVFLGYSVPPDDFLTRAAIRFALDERERRRPTNGRDPIRCLVVTKFDDSDFNAMSTIVKNFWDVFGTGFGQRNLLSWTFGEPAPTANRAPPAKAAAKRKPAPKDSPAKADLFTEIVRRLHSASVQDLPV